MVLFRKKVEAGDRGRTVQLMIVQGGKDADSMAGKLIDLQAGNNILGRDPLCEIRFSSGTVSRKHANLKVSYDKKKFTIIDLGSANGVIIKPDIHLKNEKKSLKSGDEFQIGEIVLKLTVTDLDESMQTMAFDFKELVKQKMQKTDGKKD